MYGRGPRLYDIVVGVPILLVWFGAGTSSTVWCHASTQTTPVGTGEGIAGMISLLDYLLSLVWFGGGTSSTVCCHASIQTTPVSTGEGLACMISLLEYQYSPILFGSGVVVQYGVTLVLRRLR